MHIHKTNHVNSEYIQFNTTAELLPSAVMISSQVVMFARTAAIGSRAASFSQFEQDLYPLDDEMGLV